LEREEQTVRRNAVPRILLDYLEATGQMAHWPLSDGHLLEEAEWQAYQMDEEDTSASEYGPRDKEALARFVDRLRARGVVPKHDEKTAALFG
jgi:hypothetical protein